MTQAVSTHTKKPGNLYAWVKMDSKELVRKEQNRIVKF